MVRSYVSKRLLWRTLGSTYSTRFCAVEGFLLVKRFLSDWAASIRAWHFLMKSVLLNVDSFSAQTWHTGFPHHDLAMSGFRLDPEKWFDWVLLYLYSINHRTSISGVYDCRQRSSEVSLALCIARMVARFLYRQNSAISSCNGRRGITLGLPHVLWDFWQFEQDLTAFLRVCRRSVVWCIFGFLTASTVDKFCFVFYFLGFWI